MKNESSTALRDIDAPHYSYFRALFASFYSRKLYVDVGKRWKKFSFGYFLLLIFIVTLPFSLRAIHDMNLFFNEEIANPIQQIPSLFIQNGKLSLDKPMPYFIKNKAGDIKVIVDTTGKITQIDEKYPSAIFLFTKNKFMYRMPDSALFFMNRDQKITYNDIQEMTFDKKMNQVFNGNEWLKLSGINTAKNLFLSIIYPSIALIFFSVYVTFYLALAMMGQFVSMLFYKFSLTYFQSFRLLTVSSTPQIVLLLSALTFNFQLSGFGLLLLIITVAYFAFGVFALKRESNKLVRL